MRSPANSLPLLLCLLAAGQFTAGADQSARRTVLALVEFQPRTSLTVSSSVLLFRHADPETVSVVAVDFTARARTQAAGEVVLTVESVHAIEGPGGAADVDAAVTFVGEGEGTTTGSLDGHYPSVVGRWSGSGSRDGRVLFSLRAPAPGAYSLPVRFVLTAP